MLAVGGWVVLCMPGGGGGGGGEEGMTTCLHILTATVPID